MKKIIAILLCIALAMPMVLTSCNVTDFLDHIQQNSENTTTPTQTTPESTTPPENLPEETPVENAAELYNRALSLLNERKIEEAYDIFLSIKDYADVSEYLSRFSYQYTTVILTNLESNKDISRISTTVYNQYGNELFEVSYYPYSGYSYAYYFEYDENQNLIFLASKSDDWEYKTLYKYDENNRPIWRSSPDGIAKIEYDDRGNVIKRQASYGAVYEYEYDSNNNVVKSTYINEYGEVRYAETFAYDAKGQLIQMTREDNDFVAPFSYVYTYTYDEDGNLLVEDRVLSNGHNSRYEYTYDAGGDLIKKIEKTSSRTVIYTWEYDKNGNEILEKRCFGDGTRDYMRSKIYDEAGNLIKTHYQYGASDEVVGETFYEYDEHGNLLKLSSEYYVIEYSGYTLYYNPYSNLSFDSLDSFIGK